MSDLISRQDAIDAMWKELFAYEALPSRITEYKTFCGVPIEEAARIVQEHNAEPKTGECETCKRNADNGGFYDDGRTRCPIQEHYALLKDGYCHLYEPRMRGEEE